VSVYGPKRAHERNQGGAFQLQDRLRRVADPKEFEADLTTLGFRLVQDRGSGVLQYALQASDWLTYWVHWHVNEQTVLFTWEHAIGEYLSANDLQIGANEELNQFLFPKHDARGPQDIAFVVQEMDRAEQILRSIDFLRGTA
jgi:hypothetical protein